MQDEDEGDEQTLRCAATAAEEAGLACAVPAAAAGGGGDGSGDEEGRGRRLDALARGAWREAARLARLGGDAVTERAILTNLLNAGLPPEAGGAVGMGSLGGVAPAPAPAGAAAPAPEAFGAAAAAAAVRTAAPEAVAAAEVALRGHEARLKELLAAGGRAVDTTCAICFEALEPADAAAGELCVLPCSHLFHRGCAQRWALQKATCPVCQREIFD